MPSKNTMKKNKILIALAFTFVVIVSVTIRPFFFSPELSNDEWHMSTTLRHLEIWDSNNPWSFSFNPVVTYQGPSDKFIDNNASNEEGFPTYTDTKGNYYYTSYPQFAFIAPYLFFKILFLHPNPVGLRIFGALVQILTAFFIYKILFYITKKKMVGFIGFTSYMFLPVAMYYHTNYMSDMLVPLFFMSTAYLFIKIVSEETYTKKTAVLFILSIFLMIYTEYLGLFVAGVILIYGLINHRKKFSRLLIWSSTLIPVFAMFLIAYQYSTTNNMGSFLYVMINRYTGSYKIAGTSFIDNVIVIIGEYWTWYSYSFIVILSFLALKYITSLAREQEIHKEKKAHVLKIKNTFYVLFLPVLIHNLVFINWTAFHARYFSTLKGAGLISITIGLTFWYLIYESSFYNKKAFITISTAMLVACIILSIRTYENIPYRDLFPYSYCQTGMEISKLAKDNQVIFFKDSNLIQHRFPINPVFVTCANRNIAIYKNKADSMNLIKKNHATSGIIFTITYYNKEGAAITNIETIKPSK